MDINKLADCPLLLIKFEITLLKCDYDIFFNWNYDLFDKTIFQPKPINHDEKLALKLTTDNHLQHIKALTNTVMSNFENLENLPKNFDERTGGNSITAIENLVKNQMGKSK